MNNTVPTRGVKFKYIIGEKVLCYEPDPAKAKVLYESKVLDLVAGQENGRKRPEYLVHFYGWSTSWDRCVREDWVLPMTDENRELQRRLAGEAALYLRKGRSRLPAIFKKALVKRTKVVEKKEPVSDPGSGDSSEDETEKEVIINIPEVLKLQLEEDCRCITKKNKLVAIPCFPNVVAILEGFVKHSAAKMLCESPPKNGKQFMPDDVQEKLGLYKEAADGIRVSFDSTLPHVLLYGQEKKQHYSHCSTARPHRDHHEIAPTSLKVEPPSSDPEYVPDWEPVVIKQEPVSPKSPPKRGRPRLGRSTSDPVVEETARATPAARRNSSRNRSAAGDSPVVRATAGKRQCVKSAVDKKPVTNVTANQKVETILKRKKGRPKLPPAPRVLRSGRAAVGTGPLPAKKKQPSRKTPPKTKSPLRPIGIKLEPCEDRMTRRGSVHARIAMENHTAHKTNFCTPELTHKPECSSLEDRITRSGTHRNTMENHFAASPLSPCSLITSCSTLKVGSSSNGARRLEGLLKEVVGWRMLPEHVWEVVPAEPSLVYGAQHLLRLFMKLPDLISKMRIPNRKLQPLLDIFHQFLAYMSEQRERLFPPSAYVDCPGDK